MDTILECYNCIHYRPGGVASKLCIECANSQVRKVNFSPLTHIVASEPGISIADRIAMDAAEVSVEGILAQAVEGVHLGETIPRYTYGWDLAYDAAGGSTCSS